ncbi:hypothetical protein V8C86DRAFT_1800929 [Haematococcus lacustris]
MRYTVQLYRLASPGLESSFGHLDGRQHIPFNDLQLHELLTVECQREVYRGYWCTIEVAIICRKGGGKMREARLLQRQFKHPNLLMFYGWSLDGSGNEYMIVELAAYGPLDVLLRQQGHTLRTAEKMVLCEQVCAGMHALALEGVKHANLAASSVLVHSTQPWIVKVRWCIHPNQALLQMNCQKLMHVPLTVFCFICSCSLRCMVAGCWL